MEQQKEKTTTTLYLKNRTTLILTGISDIVSSDENSVCLDTLDGGLMVEGSELHIISMNVESGEITIEGKVDSITYHDKTQVSKNGFFARMFK
ncbi:MAG: sporulation protein YabP [Clostridia bacterium]|nr:sporulation protein YabP [Clostridia bacterium]